MANPRMEGTHNPMKRAACFSPVNHKVSANIKESSADNIIRISDIENFLSIKKKIDFNKYSHIKSKNTQINVIKLYRPLIFNCAKVLQNFVMGLPIGLLESFAQSAVKLLCPFATFRP